MYEQVVAPDLSVVGIVAWCLDYSRRVFQAPVVESTAWIGFINARYKHIGWDFPPGVAVPIWFDYWYEGERLGHVAIRMPTGQIYSSPYSPYQSYAVLDSIPTMQRIYGLGAYMGWSEDISGVRVVKPKEDDMQEWNSGDFYNLYTAMYGTKPTDKEMADFADWAKNNKDQLLYETVIRKFINLRDENDKLAKNTGNCSPEERQLLDLLKKVV